LTMRRRRGGAAEEDVAPREGESKQKKRRKDLVGRGLLLVGAGLFWSWNYVALVAPPPRQLNGPLFAVLGTMGAGTVAMEGELRRLGIEATHEVTLGVDGSVSWLHAILYHNATAAALCDDLLPQAWHPQLLFVELRQVCGDSSRCWTRQCPDALDRWRGCAVAGTCPVPFRKKPLVVVRHPLRTAESLGDFCHSTKLIAAARLLGEPGLAESGCPAQLLRYWLLYYRHLAAFPVVRREDLTDGCALLSHLHSASPRLALARRACAGSLTASFWTSAYRFRQFVHELKANGIAGFDPLNRRFDPDQRPALTWDDLAIFADDPGFRTDLATLALAFGYDDASPFAA